METGKGRFQNMMRAGRHRLFANEPTKMGGLDRRPTPYDFHSSPWGVHLDYTPPLSRPPKHFLGRISVDVAYDKILAAACAADASSHAKIDRFTRTIAVDAEMTEELRAKDHRDSQQMLGAPDA